MIRKYHNHKPQTTPWHREEEPLNHHEAPGRLMKQSGKLSPPHLSQASLHKSNFVCTNRGMASLIEKQLLLLLFRES